MISGIAAAHRSSAKQSREARSRIVRVERRAFATSERQRHDERAAPLERALDGNGAAHAPDEGGRDRQPQPGTAKPSRDRPVGLRECLEDRGVLGSCRPIS